MIGQVLNNTNNDWNNINLSLIANNLDLINNQKK